MSRPEFQTLHDCVAQIVEAAERISQYTANLTEEAFFESHLVQDAVSRNLKAISESARIADELHSELYAIHGGELRKCAFALHQVFSHGYLRVDTRMAWYVAKETLPSIDWQSLCFQSGITKQ